MPDKIRVPLSQPWIDDLVRERDALRAEVEQKRKDIDYLLERQREQLTRADGLITEMRESHAEVERLRAVETAVRERIKAHNAQVKKHGGKSCQDEFCQTFKPLIAELDGAKPRYEDQV